MHIHEHDYVVLSDVFHWHLFIVKGEMQSPFELVYPGILFHEWLILIMRQTF